MNMNPSRRSIITGLISLVAAPAIVRASSLMPVRALPLTMTLDPVPPLLADGEYYICTYTYAGSPAWFRSLTIDEEVVWNAFGVEFVPGDIIRVSH